MTFHTHPDWQALLRTICTYPEADLPRLVAADWLEADAPTPCPEYAEFIRAMIEFASVGHPDWIPRIREMFHRQYQEWFAHNIKGITGFELSLWSPSSSAPCGVIRRGFITEVRAPLAWLIGGGCEACGGEGQARFYHPIEIERVVDCDTCHGTGRIPGHLDELVRTQPVTRVVVSDRRLRDSGNPNSDWRCWVELDLTPEVFREIKVSLPHSYHGRYVKWFETESEALDALSLALLNPARTLAGLPPLHLRHPRGSSMTDDQLRKIAERVRYALETGTQVDEWDRRALAHAYLAEHPADDGEPLTRDRFIEFAWQDAGGLWCSPPTPTGECVTLDYHDNRESGDVYRLIRCGGLPRVEVSTVGELRRLCDTFGVPLHPAATSAASAASAPAE